MPQTYCAPGQVFPDRCNSNIAGIHSVVISGDNGSVGFASLEYGVLTALPDPETYVLMLAGLGLVGALARRRKAGQQ